ncbi:MAG TPA: homoserine O-acetyltransferase [Alphaproteobacteria bacterium]
MIAATPAWALDEIVTPQVFEIADYATARGELIEGLRVGWEAYGKLNLDKDNAILIVPYFSGTPHAAGKYDAADAQPGYWDAIIGPGKPLDTGTYYIVSADALCDVQVKDPHVTTTGPATIDPRTGERYGLDFPAVSIRDFVAVQKALLENLGIFKLRAVVGFSMGAAQALQWAVAYPHMVERAILVTPWARADAWQIATIYAWTAPILRDPAWNGGAYYGAPEPVEGLAAAYEVAFMDALGPAFLNATFGRKWAEDGNDPAAAPDNRFAVETWLQDTARAYAETGDANHFLCQAKAIQLFEAGQRGDIAEALARVTAKTLLLPAAGDIILPHDLSDEIAAQLTGAPAVERAVIPGGAGHMNGSTAIGEVGAAIARFLAE